MLSSLISCSVFQKGAAEAVSDAWLMVADNSEGD